jgi:phosphatidylserine/phosphatidylglycerophosphate/cardiolipin synthase-like enzyme
MDVVPGVLRAARRSILIEQQYIRASEEKISDLLDAIKDAKRANSRLDVRIVLGKVFSASDLAREREMLLRLEQVCGLKLGRNVRYVNTQRLVHCHNKMVLVDGSGVLVSSQNWSKAAVWENREAGLYFQHKGVCGYFTRIFETDWKDAFRQLPAPPAESLTPHDLAGGGYVRVDPGDYAEV